MATSWSLDFCMACDRQCATGEAYCSQSCRLADLDTYGTEPVSPRSRAHSPSFSMSKSYQSNGFHLPPAFDFSAHRTKPASSTKPSTASCSSQTPSSPASHARRRPRAMDLQAASRRSSTQSTLSSSPRILTPSSSRSSLSSVQGSPLQGEFMSNRTRNELQDYTNNFDHVRDWRRRLTTS